MKRKDIWVPCGGVLRVEMEVEAEPRLNWCSFEAAVDWGGRGAQVPVKGMTSL